MINITRNKTIMSIAIAVILTAFSLSAQSTQFKALVVGIADYSAQPDYDDIATGNTVNDAADMRLYLMNYQSWSSIDIEIKVNDEATASEIETYINNMPNTRGTSGLFFYSGHGSDDLDGIIPYTGKIDASNLLNDFKDADGNDYYQFCCIFNACHSGYFTNNMTRGEILTSSKEWERSYANGPDNNSVFSYYILEGLKNNQADPAAGHVVSAKELYDYAADDAEYYARHTLLVSMRPQYLGNLGVFNFQNLKTTSGALQDDELWDQISLTGDVTVPTGCEIAIPCNSIVYLNGHSIISTGGTITVQSGATINGLRAKLDESGAIDNEYKGLFSSIQAAVNAAVALDEIYIEDGPFTENLSISGKDNLFISGGEINGSITATNSDGLHLRYIECSNLYLNNCEMPYLFNVHMLGSGSGTGIYVFNIGNSSIPKSTLVSYNFSTGLYAITSYFGIEAQSWLYDLNTAVSSNYSSNISLNGIELCGITGYHLAAYTNGYIISSGCYYDNGIPSIMESGGTVYCYTANTCPVYKRGNIAGSVESEIIPYPTEDEFGKINDHLNNLSNQIKSEFKEGSSFDKSKHKDEFLSINNQLKDYIKNNPESKQRGAAVTTAVHCYKAVEDYEAMKEFIEEIKDESDIGGYAERFMIDYYSEQKDFDKALSVADELLEKEKSDLTINVLYAKGLLLAHDMDKPKEAAVCFSQIVQNFSDNPIAEMAANQLSILGIEISEEKDNKTATKEDMELSSSNYPNPFNPTTKISFTLPVDGKVSLKVFDTLGREVADLANNVYAAGTHEVEFDASDLASGIYFYTIKTAQGNITKKMLLVK